MEKNTVRTARERTFQRENEAIKIAISYGYKTREWSLGTLYLLFGCQNQHTIYIFSLLSNSNKEMSEWFRSL